MFAHARRFASSHFNSNHLGLRMLGSVVRAVFEPRKPRHRALRFMLGLAGVMLLAVLVVVGIAVGALMLTLGLGYRLLTGGSRRPAASPGVMEGQYRIVSRPALPASH